MDERTFDRIARLFAARRGRREVAAALGALVAGASALPAAAAAQGDDLGTARCGKKGDPCDVSSDCCSGYKCNKKKGKCKAKDGSCRTEGDDCSRDSDCCSDLICDSRGRCNQGESRVTFVRKWGEFGFADGQFDTPSGIGLDTDDGGVTVYVADTFNDRIQKFDSDGGFLTKFGDSGSGDQLLNEPHGVAVNKYSGDIYVADTASNKIKMWKNDGRDRVTYDRSYGSRGSSEGRFISPMDIAVTGNRSVLVYVADAGNDRIEEFSRDTRNLIFENEFGWNDLAYPSGVAVGRSYIYVSDTDNDRIVAYDRDNLDFVFEFGTRGSGDRQFRGPQGLSYDPEYDELYVADSGNNRIMAFDEEGYYLFKWGTLGTGDLQFDRPRSIAADNRTVYVADTGNNRVMKFTVGRS